MSDDEFEMDIVQNDFDFYYYNIDDIDVKIDALYNLFKNGNADGHDIVATMYNGPQDTSPREDFMGEIKGAIKQYHPEVYDKLFMYDIGESKGDTMLDEGMCTLQCKYCDDMLGKPTTDCPYDSMNPKGENWVMVDIDGDGDKDIAISKTSMMNDINQSEEVDEVAESIAKMKAMAGVGSKAKSNHGIHEGEEGYQLTPRSIVARQMRKLQDIEQGKQAHNKFTKEA